MKKAALISVSDKTGLVPFAKGMSELGFVILATSGSKKFLEEEGVPVESIEQYTGQNEILDGRVKTLHPKIHAGLLAKRDNPTHMQQLAEANIYPIDVAVINLYPFSKGLQQTDIAVQPAKMIELIDIGGPTMIRASAKNFSGVLPVLDPNDYQEVLKSLAEYKEVSKVPVKLRQTLARKVFTFTANYDLQIAKYLSCVDSSEVTDFAKATVNMDTSFELGAVTGVVLEEQQQLRYGENPHQSAKLYSSVDGIYKSNFTQLNGKELSYNNLLDFDAAVQMIQSLPTNKTAAVIIKHLNPCGAAFGPTVDAAIENAKKCDPRSHFGGIIATNKTLTVEAAKSIAQDFAEIVVAPDYDPAAVEQLKSSKNLRVLKVPMDRSTQFDFRSLQSGFLVQQADTSISVLSDTKIVSSRAPTAGEEDSLIFAWKMCAQVKSNAIVIAKNEMLVGVGAGQMSRVDSAEIAVHKAKLHGHDLKGAVAASDAFFPFPDGLEFLAAQGISAIIAPGGAKRDSEVIEAANRLGVALLFAPDRHFRH